MIVIFNSTPIPNKVSLEFFNYYLNTSKHNNNNNNKHCIIIVMCHTIIYLTFV